MFLRHCQLTRCTSFNGSTFRRCCGMSVQRSLVRNMSAVSSLKHDRSLQDPNIDVKGLCVVDNFLTKNEHDNILQELTAFMAGIGQPFTLTPMNERARKELPSTSVRKTKTFFGEAHIKSFPSIYSAIQRVQETGVFPRGIDSLQINEYEADQGCDEHTDARSIGEVIGMFSIESPTVMDLIPPEDGSDGEQKMKLLLNPGSLVIMSDDVRYKWTHGIQSKPVLSFADRQIQKAHRFSVVFWRSLDSFTQDPKARANVTVRTDVKYKQSKMRLGSV